jgi:putative DNA primase/helicase
VVLAAELAEGKRLNESLIKDLTGGDKIVARFLHKEYFEFNATFKLWMYGNHKPVIRGSDEGIWRRIRLVPFTVIIPEPEQDKRLAEKLRAELPGILAWAVRGCQAWQGEGLQAPAIVSQATQSYREEQDLLAAFLEECCLVGELYRVTASDLYDAYKKWAVEAGEISKSQRYFSQAMAERGYRTDDKERDPGTDRKIYKGMGLRSSQTPEIPFLQDDR